MKKILLLGTFLLLLVLSACGSNDNNNKQSQEAESNNNESQSSSTPITSYPQFTDVQENEREVLMETSKGNIKIKLFPEYAPKAVGNFITHAENGYYNGLKFHRILKDFMIQGGDPLGNGTGGESIWKKPFEDEFSSKLYNFRGALSMANSGPNSNGSQFFIVQAKTVDPSLKEKMTEAKFPKEVVDAYMEKGGTPWLDNVHTVFGQVIDGMDVVDDIANVETDENGVATKDVIIKSIKIIK